MDIGFEEIRDWEAVGARWRALQAAADGGFFRSWDFIGCQAAARFDAPWLLTVRAHGADQALGLLNRHAGHWHLNVTGRKALDTVYIEHNGLLLRAAASGALAAGMAALAARGRVVLAGVDDAHLAAARAAGLVVGLTTQPAPAVALDAVRGRYLDSLSANARAQIRRALRLCGGDVALRPAVDVAETLAWFDAMVTLHQAHWARRGKPGAFADPAICEFHRELLGRAAPAGAAAMLRVTAAEAVVGYLYVLLGGGIAHAYQSGFVAPADARHKPGLICHALAVEHFRAAGMARYDLMVGADRYKLTLAPQGGQNLHWFTLHPRGSWRAQAALAGERLAARLRAALT